MVLVPPKKRSCVVITKVSSRKWLSASCRSYGKRRQALPWARCLLTGGKERVWGSRSLHLIHLVEKAVDEIARLPDLPGLPVRLDLFGDENTQLRKVS